MYQVPPMEEPSESNLQCGKQFPPAHPVNSHSETQALIWGECQLPHHTGQRNRHTVWFTSPQPPTTHTLFPCRNIKLNKGRGSYK